MIWLLILLAVGIVGCLTFMHGIEQTIRRRNIDRLRLKQFVCLYGICCVIGGASAVMILLKLGGEI